MKILGLAACASTALASFSDSAPFFSSRKLSADSAYIARASDVAHNLGQYSVGFCPEGEELHIYRVSNLAAAAPAKHSGTFFENVHYRTVDDLELVVDSFFHHDGQKPQITDVEDGQYSVEDFLAKSSCVIVQGKPSFHRAGSGLDAVKQFLEDVNDKFKRDSAADEYEKDVEEDLAAVDAVVSAVAEAEKQLEDADLAESTEELSVSSLLSSNSNLFTEYQFFTPGVWLAIIVSLFLVYVVSTAVGWITSIQTSYHSFEKLVDYEKKTE